MPDHLACRREGSVRSRKALPGLGVGTRRGGARPLQPKWTSVEGEPGTGTLGSGLEAVQPTLGSATTSKGHHRVWAPGLQTCTSEDPVSPNRKKGPKSLPGDKLFSPAVTTQTRE